MNKAAFGGAVVLVGFGGFVSIALLVLLGSSPGGFLALPFERLSSPYTARIFSFTLLQAVMSVVLSVLGALPLALILARHRSFLGRNWIVRLLALPLALPPLVAVIGLLEVWGRSGLVSGVLSMFGSSERLSVFGLEGVVLAHVFFNLPLAARLMLTHLDRQPATLFRLADQLGLTGRARFRRVELPILRPHLPSIAGLIMMLCIGSFTIVLTLGGGPSAATFEVAIYQALRFDFNPPLAALFTLVQLALAGSLLLVLHCLGGAPEDRAGVEPSEGYRADTLSLGAKSVLTLYGFFLLSPLIALIIGGLSAEWSRLAFMPRLWSAAATSLIIAVSAALLSVLAAYCLIVGRDRGIARQGFASATYRVGYASVGSAVLAIPPIVLGAGWFLILRGVPHQTVLAASLVVVVNALMALPFVLRALAPAHEAAQRRYGALAASLGLKGWWRFVRVDAPVLAKPFAAACAFALVLSVGDLGAAAIFGAYDLQTLPILILNLMGSYRTMDAAGVALALALFVFALITLADRINRITL